ncbi:hypothetical protein [Asaia bogorensis]|uniref:hypothetical protein n=1 Tax=Asaia bogorensis TaxID=91915 RepID=UPI003017D6A8
MTYEQKPALGDFETKDCLSISGAQNENGDVTFYRVGQKFWRHGTPTQREFPVTERITLQRDVHGEMCMKTRACVWVRGKIVVEIPYQALTFIEYAQ